MVYNSPIHAVCRFFPSLSPTKTYNTAAVPRSLSTDYCPQSFNMKTSIFISIIVTCMGLRSLANVIPPSIRELSRGATFRRYNMARAILGRISSDEAKLKSVRLLQGASLSTRHLYWPLKRDAEKKNDDKDHRDIRHLNHALFLKRFLCSFFARGLSRYSQEDLIRAGYPDWVRARYTQMFNVAKVHRDFLESAITSAGSERVRPCNVEVGDNNVCAFIDQSAAGIFSFDKINGA